MKEIFCIVTISLILSLNAYAATDLYKTDVEIKIASTVKQFNAAFIMDYRGTMINYFSMIDSDFLGNYVGDIIDNTCFNGSVNDGLQLLKEIIKQGGLNYDELWYEDPRSRGKDIIISRFDDFNQQMIEITIVPCDYMINYY